MPIKAVIFDMGGVLLRTTDQTPREQLAEQLGITRDELERLVFISESSLLAETGQISEQQHWEFILNTLGVPEEHRLEFQRMFWSKDRIDDELIEYIRKLHAFYRTGLLSNAWDGMRQAALNRFPQLMEVFDVAVFSAEVGMRKPDARYYHWILERLSVAAEESVFIDDYPPNVDAAIKVGMNAIRFIDPQQMRRDLSALLDHKIGDKG